MDLNLLRLDTLIPAVSCCEFYAKNHQLYVLMFDTDDMIFVGTLILYYTHRNTYTQDTQGSID